jgi:putative transcriptional regulator
MGNEAKNEFFEDLRKSLAEGLEHAKGKRKDLRTTTLLRPLAPMKKSEIVRLRKNLNISQAVFANYLNISIKTVQSWEQGTGTPGGAALKLLSLARRNPSILTEV